MVALRWWLVAGLRRVGFGILEPGPESSIGLPRNEVERFTSLFGGTAEAGEDEGM